MFFIRLVFISYLIYENTVGDMKSLIKHLCLPFATLFLDFVLSPNSFPMEPTSAEPTPTSRTVLSSDGRWWNR